MLCFLEAEADHLVVNDLIYLREGTHWVLQKSAYRKLRLRSESVAAWVRSADFEVEQHTVEKGLITIVARVRSA